MSTAGISANKLELLQIAKAVADEKSIDKEIVLEAIEEAIQKAARLRYCLLYTSPSPRDRTRSRMPSSA